jgi:lysophospholipase L1-like esterase
MPLPSSDCGRYVARDASHGGMVPPVRSVEHGAVPRIESCRVAGAHRRHPVTAGLASIEVVNAVTKEKPMNRLLVVMTSIALAIACLAGSAAVVEASADNGSTHYFLAMGDSLAQGYQPDFPTSAYRDDGYVALLASALRAGDPKLALENISCGGESSVSMIGGSLSPEVASSCGTPTFYRHQYPHRTQLAEALSFLESHKGKVSLITIDIGGNDLMPCLENNLPSGCLQTVLERLAADLDTILAQIQAVAPGTRIVGMTYYDPFACLWYAGSGGQLQAGALSTIVQLLNSVLASVYAAHGVAVADVAGAFDVGAFPESADASRDMTWFCSADHPGDVHPNDAGYVLIRDTFLATISET